MKIAIVGAGISGLTAAHLLHREHERHRVRGRGYAGGHTNTVRVDTPDETHHVDTGFIVFNDRNYPNFERLLARIGVASQPSNMSFAVSDERGDFEYSSASANGLFAKRSHLATPWFHRMLADVVRFQRAGARRWSVRRADGPVARPLGRGAPLLAAVHRPPDRPAGVRGLVGRARARCGRSRRASWPSSSTTTGCSGCATARAGARCAAGRRATSRS